MMELADIADLKSAGSNTMPVQVRLPAPICGHNLMERIRDYESLDIGSTPIVRASPIVGIMTVTQPSDSLERQTLSGCSQVVWLLLWEQEIGGSSPSTQTIWRYRLKGIGHDPFKVVIWVRFPLASPSGANSNPEYFRVKMCGWLTLKLG